LAERSCRVAAVELVHDLLACGDDRVALSPQPVADEVVARGAQLVEQGVVDVGTWLSNACRDLMATTSAADDAR